MNSWTPSPAAQAEGVCCTKAEAQKLFEELPAGLKQGAVSLLREKIPAEDAATLRALIAQHGPGEWLWHLYDERLEKMSAEDKARGYGALLSPHLGFGMGVRNLLRDNHFGEVELGVHNLDCVYVQLLEAAVALVNELYPGQSYFHALNGNIRRAEENFHATLEHTLPSDSPVYDPSWPLARGQEAGGAAGGAGLPDGELLREPRAAVPDTRPAAVRPAAPGEVSLKERVQIWLAQKLVWFLRRGN